MRDSRSAPYEPDVARALELMQKAGRLPFEALSVAEARSLYRAGRETSQLPPLPVHETRDFDLAGAAGPLPARLYRPFTGGAAEPALLFFHGGGWVIGDLDTHDGICRRLALASGRTLIAIDYRLAPEHRFPAAVEDAVAAYASLVATADRIGIDGQDIAVAGDSAGGALAAVSALAAGLTPPTAAALFYPVADLRGTTPSYAAVKDVPITGATMRWFRDRYLAEPADACDWRASVLLAPSLRGFPRTFLATAGHDPLRDEAFLLADRLRRDGVVVEHRHSPGQIHGYLTLDRLIGEATRSIDAAGAFLRSRTSR